MYYFHFNSWSTPWLLFAALTLIVAVGAGYLSKRVYSKKIVERASLWGHTVLTGIGAGFILAVILVVFSSAHVQQMDEQSQTALRAFIDNSYDLSISDDDVQILYWSRYEGNVPVAATDKEGKTSYVYLGHGPRGWSLYEAQGKTKVPQVTN